MKKKQTQAQTTHATELEPFSAVAQRLGNTLADLISRDDCPSEIYNAVVELDTSVFNKYPSAAISLRHSFPQRLVALFEAEPEEAE